MVGRRPGQIFDEWLERSSSPQRLDLYIVRWEDYGSSQDGAKIPSKILDPLDRPGVDWRGSLAAYLLACAPFGAWGQGVAPSAHSVGCCARTASTACTSHPGGLWLSASP